MPTTRRSARLEPSQAEDERSHAAAAVKRDRTALGTLTNRGGTRAAKKIGRDQRESDNSAAASRRRSSRNSTGRTTCVLEDIPAVTDIVAPKRRRSGRSCVIAQRVNADESSQSYSDGSRVKSRSSSSKTTEEAKTATARGRSKKRRQVKEASSARSNKRPKRSTSNKRKAPAARKASSKARGQSTPRNEPAATKRRRSASGPRKPCSAFVTQTNYGLARVPFDSSKFTLGIAPHDEATKDNVLEVSNYATDIFQRLYIAETPSRSRQYMANQDEITPAMRAILIDWLVEVHMKFRLVPQTLYLCVNIIDRFCSRVVVERRRLQLVGVTALLVACKYEEIYPPEVRDCVYITDRTYTRQEVLDMEQEIVRELEFKMTVPHAHNFLTRFLTLVKASELVKSAANYYLERTLQEYDFLQYRGSLVAASAVCLALSNPDIRNEEMQSDPTPGLHPVLLDYTGFDAEQVKECAALIASKVGGEDTIANRRQLVAVKKKYDSRKYHHISSEFDDPDVAQLNM